MPTLPDMPSDLSTKRQIDFWTTYFRTYLPTIIPIFDEDEEDEPDDEIGPLIVQFVKEDKDFTFWMGLFWACFYVHEEIETLDNWYTFKVDLLFQSKSFLDALLISTKTVDLRRLSPDSNMFVVSFQRANEASQSRSQFLKELLEYVRKKYSADKYELLLKRVEQVESFWELEEESIKTLQISLNSLIKYGGLKKHRY